MIKYPQRMHSGNWNFLGTASGASQRKELLTDVSNKNKNLQVHHILMLCQRLFDLETALPCNSWEARQTFADLIKPTKTTLKQAERLTSLSRWLFESEKWKKEKNIETIHFCLSLSYSSNLLCAMIWPVSEMLQDLLGSSHPIHQTDKYSTSIVIVLVLGKHSSWKTPLSYYFARCKYVEAFWISNLTEYNALNPFYWVVIHQNMHLLKMFSVITRSHPIVADK